MERCTACHVALIHEASRAWIIDRIQDWAERFGDPPGAADWNRSPSMRARNPAAALRQDDAADDDWPSNGTVQKTFGSWNAAIKAAGFTPLPRGRKRHTMEQAA